MLAFLARKLAQYGLVLLIAVTLNFLLPRLMPGSSLNFIAGQDVARLSAEQRERVLSAAGLDRPLPEQYGRYLADLAQADLGYSFQQRQPVADLLLERLPWTLLLTGTALVIATVIGVLLGAYAAWRRGGRADMASLGVLIFLESLPSFWIGMVFIAVFGVQLRLLPTFGAFDLVSRPEGIAYWLDIGEHLVLPATALILASIPSTFLTMRYSMLSVLGEDYITVARAKGARERQVLLGHAARNALLPVLTLFTIRLGFAVQGAVVIETVFSYPGIGRTVFEAALSRDYPLLQGAFLLLTCAVIAANLLADLLYPLLDPRITARAGGG